MEPALKHWSEQIRAAAANNCPLQIRGGGSKDFYGQPTGGELLDTRGYQGVTSYEPSELVVTARAGTPVSELEALLAERGQCLPFEPPHFGGAASPATVGGMVAAGLSGPARASVGAVRDYVLGLSLLNGRGEFLTFGGQVMKNVAGYDVSRLMVGAMGTLGVITEVSLKVLPVAPAEATLMATGIGQQVALDLLNRWGGQPLPLNASCWVRDEGLGPAQDCLFVRLRGAAAAVATAGPRMGADMAALGGVVRVLDPAQAGPDWQSCRDQALPFFVAPARDLALWRFSVPQTAARLALPYPQFIEWHGAQRWLWAPLSAQAELRQAASQAAGHATLFKVPQDPSLVSEARFQTLAEPLQRISRAIKQQFDPAGVLNQGRI
ncbi:MAG: glycolate oxidase subunit GlcE [Burkholderiaceae bacterium]